MKTPEQIKEALQRHYGEGWAYPCEGCPYQKEDSKGRNGNCRFELTRDALWLVEKQEVDIGKLVKKCLDKSAYIERVHRKGTVANFAYEPGELVFAPARVFDRRSTRFDFKVIDDPERPVQARVTACVYGIDAIRYEIRALDKNLRMQGMRVVIDPQHLIRPEEALRGMR